MISFKQNHLVSLNMRRLSALECYQLGSRLVMHLEGLSDSYESDPQLPKSEAAIKKSLKTFKEVLDGTEKLQEHYSLQAANNQRKEDFRALVNALEAFKKIRRSTEEEAYQKLSSLIRGHKEATRVSYEKATAHYTILLANLDKEPYKEAMTNLGLTRFVTYLKESQEAFETRYKAVSDVKKKQANHPILGAVREAFYRDYKILIDYCLLMMRISDGSIYPAVLNAINQDRKYYANCLALRKARRIQKTNQEENKEKEPHLP